MSKVLAMVPAQRRARQGEYGAGSVSYNKRDDTHTARVMLDGEREYLGVYPTNEEAWRVIAAFWEDYDRGIIGGGKGAKLGQFGLDCIDEREKAGEVLDSKNERSRWRTYVSGGEFTIGKKKKTRYEVARDPIADVALPDLRPADIREWLARQARQTSPYPFKKGSGKRSAETLRHALQLLRTVLRIAVDEGKIESNPAIGITPKVDKRTRRKEVRAEGAEAATTYTEDELRRFWTCEQVPRRVRLWHMILVGLGLRAGEFADAFVEDLHLAGESPYLHLRDTKNGRPHDVPLFGFALTAMREWVAELPKFCKRNPKRLLWPGRNGGRRSEGHWWGKVSVKGATPKQTRQVDALPVYLARAGISRRFRTHDTRHTCGTALLSGEWGKAWSMEAVKKLLNHADIRTTQRYAKLKDTALDKIARDTRGLPGFEEGLPSVRKTELATDWQRQGSSTGTDGEMLASPEPKVRGSNPLWRARARVEASLGSSHGSSHLEVGEKGLLFRRRSLGGGGGSFRSFCIRKPAEGRALLCHCTPQCARW